MTATFGGRGDKKQNSRSSTPSKLNRSHSPMSQEVEGQNFQTWNKNENFPNVASNKLMQRMQSAATKQVPLEQNQAPSAFLSTFRGPAG